MTTDQHLERLGYTQIFPDTWELKLYPDLAWMVESDQIGHSLSEWTGVMWRLVAIYLDDSLLVASLEALKAAVDE